MSARIAGTKRHWAWATVGAMGAMACLFALFSFSRAPGPVSEPLSPHRRIAIELAERRQNSALDDEATLLDPTPLFQPTQWSTTQLDVARPETSGTFQNYRVPPHWVFADSGLKLREETGEKNSNKVLVDNKDVRTSLGLPVPVEVPPKQMLARMLESGLPGSVAIGFGRSDRAVMSLTSRGALVDIVAVGTGQVALRPQAMARVEAIAAGARPPSGRPWHAMEFFAAVDAGGLLAPLTITKLSGVEEVDAYFQNFLARTIRVGERLAPGFYRISVGP